ncbi:uracil-DNA glycosylase family protein [Chitinimonas sp.]|uniref:uracil-DNA glycosylase family protein n=1 Tax=Chitinimonas sp. TaxID=1934313 RepID=UPI002F95D0E5
MPGPREEGLADVLAAARACTVCAAHLPLGPRPVVRMAASARLLIIGQAPGTKVHETGIPWNDASGRHLRQWLQMEDAVFYDERRVAIMPMGFCYPGVQPRGGDKPPRKECAPLWHQRLLLQLPDVRLVLLVGQYAQRHYLMDAPPTMTETVRGFERYLPRFFPLPHPSWRSTLWLRQHPWFASEVLPRLHEAVAAAMAEDGT